MRSTHDPSHEVAREVGQLHHLEWLTRQRAGEEQETDGGDPSDAVILGEGPVRLTANTTPNATSNAST
jgi:hypothetical protein